MLKPYIIAGKLPKKSELAVVITREDYVPGIWEPITCADTKEYSIAIARHDRNSYMSKGFTEEYSAKNAEFLYPVGEKKEKNGVSRW